MTVEMLNDISNDSMVGYLGIEFTEVGKDYMKATMPVDHRTQQPHGLLHGGASATLAETLGSVGAMSVIDNNMTQSFFPNDVKVENRAVIVKGESIRRIGAAKPVKEKVMYKMKFNVVNYKVYLTEFYIDYPDKIRRAIINKMKGVTDEDHMIKQFEKIEKEMK